VAGIDDSYSDSELEEQEQEQEQGIWLWGFNAYQYVQMDADCLVGTEFATRPQQKRHKSMTDGLSISVYYMGCLDQGPDRCFEPLKVSDKKPENNNSKIFVRQNLQVSPDIYSTFVNRYY